MMLRIMKLRMVEIFRFSVHNGKTGSMRKDFFHSIDKAYLKCTLNLQESKCGVDYYFPFFAGSFRVSLFIDLGFP